VEDGLCQRDGEDRMRSAALCVHLSGSHCAGLVALGHQLIYVLQRKKVEVDVGMRTYVGKMDLGMVVNETALSLLLYSSYTLDA